MTPLVPLGFSQAELTDNTLFLPTEYTQQQAEQANSLFDNAVRQYLRDWIEQGVASGSDQRPEAQADLEEFIQHGALRVFFKHHPDALERLLQQDDIARHLLRPHTEVFFQRDAYEPLLATFERRIYNLAAHREHLEVPFRYSPMSRQDNYGNSVSLADMPAESVREDIGCYFGTRRSDATALQLLARQLRRETLFATILPVSVVVEGYMVDSLRSIRLATQQLHDEGQQSLCCFVVQRRHAADDRHLGAALLLMDTRYPDQPQRIIFCDTLKPNGQPPWWNKFKGYVDAVFPQPEGCAPTSDRLEDGGVNLQRLHDNVPIRHQDIDCAFYSASMARALIQLAKLSPELIIRGSITDLVSAMTERMPEYFVQADMPKEPETIREVNVVRRWQTGQEALTALRACFVDPQPIPAELDRLTWDSLSWDSISWDSMNWQSASGTVANTELSVAA